MEITRSYSFDASHQLDWHPGKCARLHGHTYVLEVTISGPLDQNGVVMEFGELDRLVAAIVLDDMDHRHLNDEVENPTAENLVQHIWEKLSRSVLNLSELVLRETPRSAARIRA